MGYFLSLFSWTESATSTALDISELVLLVSGLFLLFGAAGEYLFDHDRLPLCMKWPKLTFEIIVALSLGGELIADGGVAVFSHVLQKMEGADIDALGMKAGKALSDANEAENRSEKLLEFLTPRSLTQKEMDDLRDAFKPFADANVPVVVVGSQFSLSGLYIQIWRSLKDAGFDKAEYLEVSQPLAYGMGASGSRKYGFLAGEVAGALLKARIGPMNGTLGIGGDADPIRIFVGDIRTAPLPSLPAAK